jgi:hypothetical protein
VRRDQRCLITAGLLASLMVAHSLQAQRESGARMIGGVHAGAPLLVSAFAAAVWDRGEHSF